MHLNSSEPERTSHLRTLYTRRLRTVSSTGNSHNHRLNLQHGAKGNEAEAGDIKRSTLLCHRLLKGAVATAALADADGAIATGAAVTKAAGHRPGGVIGSLCGSQAAAARKRAPAADPPLDNSDKKARGGGEAYDRSAAARTDDGPEAGVGSREGTGGGSVPGHDGDSGGTARAGFSPSAESPTFQPASPSYQPGSPSGPCGPSGGFIGGMCGDGGPSVSQPSSPAARQGAVGGDSPEEFTMNMFDVY